ncbi:hypothetical protein DFH09DRAFT_1192960, partial [Mycena vulgaris]
MGKLASTNHRQGKLNEAEELYIKLLDRQTARFGADHPDTLRTANYLAQTCKAMERN